jgi:hypothetical protein
MKLLTQNSSLLSTNPLHKSQREGIRLKIHDSLEPLLREAMTETRFQTMNEWANQDDLLKVPALKGKSYIIGPKSSGRQHEIQQTSWGNDGLSGLVKTYFYYTSHPKRGAGEKYIPHFTREADSTSLQVILPTNPEKAWVELQNLIKLRYLKLYTNTKPSDLATYKLKKEVSQDRALQYTLAADPKKRIHLLPINFKEDPKYVRMIEPFEG